MKITFYPKYLDFFYSYVGCYGTVELDDYFRQCTDIEGNNVLPLAGPLGQRRPAHSIFRHVRCFDPVDFSAWSMLARTIFWHGQCFSVVNVQVRLMFEIPQGMSLTGMPDFSVQLML